MKSFEDMNILIKVKLICLNKRFFWKKVLFEKKKVFENKNMFLKKLKKNRFLKKTVILKVFFFENFCGKNFWKKKLLPPAPKSPGA